MTDENQQPQDENKLIAERRSKLNALREQASAEQKSAFPNDFRRDSLAADLQAELGELDNEALEVANKQVSIAGRMMAKRIMGKASFCQLQDMSGRMQAFVQRDAVGEDVYKSFKGWDVGDIIAVQGNMFRTKTGELSVRAESIRLLTKSLRPLPEKWHGLTDTETRYRQRYVDLIMNPEVREVFTVRNQAIRYIREFFDNRGFLEVETPMLQPLAGGAAARPFTTHHNALDSDMFLRIAPELYLKRLVVGGFEKVYEINRNFRNEGLSTRHNPEFTMLEFYQAYADYRDLINLTEELLRGMVLKITGGEQITYQGDVYDFGKPFACFTMKEAVMHYGEGIDASRLDDADYLREQLVANKAKVDASWGTGKLLTELFEATAEHLLMQPTFITEYPTEVSPLARRNDDNPEVTDRFEFFCGGREIGNGFSELNDAEDQAERFQAQVDAKDAGDDEAMFYDADYVRALEYGLPPTAGEGIGIDRLVMLLTDSPSIRDVLLFPQMRAEA